MLLKSSSAVIAVFGLVSYLLPVVVESSTAAVPTPSLKRLTEETMNPNLRKMEYAVRGTVVIAADKIGQELKEGGDDNQSKKYDFDKILACNIGNPHSVGQKPLTWPRQVLALVDLPQQAY